jgi:RNA polymerase sigma factor (sigma-70 family)
VSDKLLSLMETCGPQLHALLLKLTLRRDAAEDLLQELCVKLLRSAPFHNARDPRAYAFRAAIHLALDARQHRRFTTLPDALLSADLAPPEAHIRAELSEQLLAAVAELSPQAREATVLHFIRQLTYEQAAHLMDKTPQQVRGLCSDALRQLRDKFRIPTTPRGAL